MVVTLLLRKLQEIQSFLDKLGQYNKLGRYHKLGIYHKLGRYHKLEDR